MKFFFIFKTYFKIWPHTLEIQSVYILRYLYNVLYTYILKFRIAPNWHWLLWMLVLVEKHWQTRPILNL
jgi:hypothetical protein